MIPSDNNEFGNLILIFFQYLSLSKIIKLDKIEAMLHFIRKTNARLAFDVTITPSIIIITKCSLEK